MKYKLKYEVLSKEEKDKFKKDYYNTPNGKQTRKNFLIGYICAFIVIFYSLIFLAKEILDHGTVLNIVYYSVMIVVGFVLLFVGKHYETKILNNNYLKTLKKGK